MAKGQMRSNKEPRKLKTSDKKALPKYLRAPDGQQTKLGAIQPERKK